MTPIFAYIPVPIYICSSGYLEVYSDSWNLTSSNATLEMLLVLASFMLTVLNLSGLWIIKNQNAMQKTVLSLLKTFTMWAFFLLI